MLTKLCIFLSIYTIRAHYLPNDNVIHNYHNPPGTKNNKLRSLQVTTATCQDYVTNNPTFQPFRITFDTSTLATDLQGSPGGLAYITDTLLPNISNYFQNVFSVRRRQNSNLFASRACAVFEFSGICSDNLPLPSTTCGPTFANGFQYELNDDWMGHTNIYSCTAADLNACTDVSSSCAQCVGKTGIPDSDFHIMLTVKDLQPTCGSSTVAFASSCQTDECDRPTFGFVNLCVNSLTYATYTEREFLFESVIHEIIHAMGFNTDTYAFFRQEDGYTPRLPRDSVDGLPSARVKFDCSNGVVSAWNDENGSRRYYDPTAGSTPVVQFKSGRGIVDAADCKCPRANNYKTLNEVNQCLSPPRSSCLFEITTPKVVETARAFYGCPTATGVELENTIDYATCEILSSHWDHRAVGYEMMMSVGVDGGSSYMSPMTLAFFEDSGWYQVNYTLGQSDLVSGAIFGYQEGCGFLDNKCVDTNSQALASDTSFCSTLANTAVCHPNGRYGAVCTATASPTLSNIFSWFTYPVQSDNLYADYCPVYGAISNTNCEFSSATANANLQGAVNQANSRCLMTTSDVATCYVVNCNTPGTSYEVIDGNGNSIGTCSSSTDVLNNQVKCGSPSVICAQLRSGLTKVGEFLSTGSVITIEQPSTFTQATVSTSTSTSTSSSSSTSSTSTSTTPAATGSCCNLSGLQLDACCFLNDDYDCCSSNQENIGYGTTSLCLLFLCSVYMLL